MGKYALFPQRVDRRRNKNGRLAINAQKNMQKSATISTSMGVCGYTGGIIDMERDGVFVL